MVDVIDDERGIAHIVDTIPDGLEPGQTIHGTIDWTRRFDHMQQHTGQHVLSAAVDRLSGVRTLSFHLGSAASTIDLARELTPEEIAAVEDEANRIVWDDRRVTIRFAGAAESPSLRLRKESKREGTLRLIDIDDFDLSACGGTHVARTGTIGMIALGSVERFKGGQRVEFFCGSRALARCRSMRSCVAAAARLLSVAPDDVVGSIERLQSAVREKDRTASHLDRELTRYRADALAATAEGTAAGKLVTQSVAADANALKALAAAIASRSGHVAVLVSTTTPALVVVARAPDAAVAAHQVVAALTSKFGGRGGGRPELAQAGGLNGDAAAILDAARAAITSAV